jgi:endoglucanase
VNCRRRLSTLTASLAVLALVTQSEFACAAPSITAEEWTLYRDKFLDPAGRIVDTANAGISHSEGQGYGLLLAFLADSRGDFDRLLAFTRTQMLLRDDGLAVWKWNPNANPHVEDINNATDGDLLIAYAAALAGTAWRRPDLIAQALAIAGALADHGVFKTAGMVLLKPGVQGFGKEERSDGPVVNPSYFVFEAIDAFAEVQPKGPWNDLSRDGLKLLKMSMDIGPAGLPPDWVSLAAKPAAAEGMPQEFGYNAVRIPLYLLRAGIRDRALLQTLAKNMTGADGDIRVVNISTGDTIKLLKDPGYRIIPALIACVLDGKPLPEDTRTFTPTEYYPSTLHLLALSFARSQKSGCL